VKRCLSIISIILTFLSIGSNRQRSASGTVHDIDGNVYKTVKIGNQWWMAENLRVTRNPQGKPIKGYYYMDDPLTYGKYGLLYTWNTAMDGSFKENAQGIAPDGWHIPSDFKGSYVYFDEYTMFWSSTASNEERAYHMGISQNNKWDKFAAKKNGRIHIRCIKDN